MTARATLDDWERESDRIDEITVALGSALGKRDWAALPALAEEVCRTILTVPERAPLELGPAFTSVEELVHALRPTASREGVPPQALLALLDLVNAFGSIGPLPPITEVIAASWLAELVAAKLSHDDHLRVGFAALAIGHLVPAYDAAGVPHGKVDYDGSQMFHDMRGVLRNFIAGTQQDPNKSLYKRGSYVLPLFGRVIDRLGESYVHATTLLWMARTTYRVFVGKDAREVPALAHKLIWEHVAEAEAEAAAAPPPPVSTFPAGATFGGGAFRVHEVLRGTGMQKLCGGRDVATGAPLLVSWDACRQRADIDALRAAARAHAPGMFELAFAGRSDADEGYWGIVERVPQGDWLPSLATAPDARMAIELGISAGELLARAAERGLVLAHVRPEYMWAEKTADGWRVTGLSARGHELFSRKGYELVTHPVFDRTYHAPERQDLDDRAMTYALASMIGAWAGPAMPAQLAELVARATHSERAERPHLAAFVDELRAVQAALARTPAR